jgi:hypothetical protein
MNIQQLKELVDAALERGIDPLTTVVVDADGDWRKIDRTDDPTQRADDSLMWFTLFVGEWADSRFDRGHYKDEE